MILSRGMQQACLNSVLIHRVIRALSEESFTIHSLTIAARTFDKHGSSFAVILRISPLPVPCPITRMLLVFLYCTLVSSTVHCEVITAMYQITMPLSESVTENSKVPHGAARNGVTLNSVTWLVSWGHHLQATGTSSHTTQFGLKSTLRMMII